MKYFDRTFSVSLGGKAFADGWDRIFAPKPAAPATFDEWAEKWNVDPYCFSDVGAGWIPLLETLAQELAALDFDFALVAQVKEKFGGLRFYVDAVNPAWDAAIDRAEAAAWKTCEKCGAPGTPRYTGWIRTLCDGCVK